MSLRLRSIRLLSSLVLVPALASPAWGGTVYLPVAPDNGIDSAAYGTRLWVSNTDPETPLSFSAFFIEAVTDGTERDRDPATFEVPPGRTFLLDLDPEGAAGLLEVSAPPELAVSARRTPQPPPQGSSPLGTPVPVISSFNAAEAGSMVTLQGWRRSVSGVRSNLDVVNLGRTSASCTVKVFRADGTQIANTAFIAVKPVSQNRYPDALRVLGETEIADVFSTITCDQPFYAFVTTHNLTTGAAVFIVPAGTGESQLAPPGDDTPSVPGAILFTRSGVFHTPTPPEPTKIFNIPVPVDESFSRVTVDLDVTFAGWSNDPRQNHSLFWLHRGACCWPPWPSNIFGYVNVFGPSRNELKVMTNADLPRFDERVIRTGLALTQGLTYHVAYVYDAAQSTVSIVMTQGGTVVAQGTGPATASSVRTNDGFFMLYLGHEDATGVGPERPTYGWDYANLRVEFVP